MNRLLCCLALAALPALGESGAITPVAVYTQFQHQPSPQVFEAIQREVAAIMSPLGFPFEWRSLEGTRGNEVAAEVAVVTFRGGCNILNLSFVTTRSGPLGVTHVSDGIVLPFTDIDCDRIRDFLRKDLLRTNSSDREIVFGRAVGRVLAHELYHVFAGTTHHGSEGVAKPVYTEHELMSDRFEFETSEFRVLRASLKQARRANDHLRRAGSPVAGQSIFQESGCASCHGALGEGTRVAPAVRVAGKTVELKSLAAKLARDVTKMYGRSKDRKHLPPELDDDEIADLVSFLNGEID